MNFTIALTLNHLSLTLHSNNESHSVLIVHFIDVDRNIGPIAVVLRHICLQATLESLDSFERSIICDLKICRFPPDRQTSVSRKLDFACTTYMELLRRRLWTILLLASREFGAMISCPSTLRNVVEKRPNSRTNKTLRAKNETVRCRGQIPVEDAPDHQS